MSYSNQNIHNEFRLTKTSYCAKNTLDIDGV